jgi:anti-sigma B factor antagonist
MEVIPPDSQEGREPAAQSEETRFGEDSSRAPRRRFTLDVTHTGRAAVVTLGGELDVVCADTFKRRFAEATEDEPENVVIDLRDLTFVDSIGLALLLRVNEMSHDRRFALWIVSAPEDPVQKIFRLTGTNTILPLVDEPPDFGPGTAPRTLD